MFICWKLKRVTFDDAARPYDIASTSVYDLFFRLYIALSPKTRQTSGNICRFRRLNA